MTVKSEMNPSQLEAAKCPIKRLIYTNHKGEAMYGCHYPYMNMIILENGTMISGADELITYNHTDIAWLDK